MSFFLYSEIFIPTSSRFGGGGGSLASFLSWPFPSGSDDPFDYYSGRER